MSAQGMALTVLATQLAQALSADEGREIEALGPKVSAWLRDVAEALAAAPEAPAVQTPTTPAARDVLAERRRQVDAEGYSSAHDAAHGGSELAQAAAVYANPDLWNILGASAVGWPWEPQAFKPKDDRRNWVRAAALLLAAIEADDRKTGSAAPGAAPEAPAQTDALKDMEARKDAAYLERNQVVAALAKAYPSGIARTAIEGWSEDWHGCVYIDLPTGQASWHFHDSQAHLFDGLPPYAGKWDGHTTEEKYARLSALKAQTTQPVREP